MVRPCRNTSRSYYSLLNSRISHDFCMNNARLHKKQESRAAARKPRDAASVLFGRSSSTTFLTSIRLAKLRKRPRFRAPNMLAQNTI